MSAGYCSVWLSATHQYGHISDDSIAQHYCPLWHWSALMLHAVCHSSPLVPLERQAGREKQYVGHSDMIYSALTMCVRVCVYSCVFKTIEWRQRIVGQGRHSDQHGMTSGGHTHTHVSTYIVCVWDWVAWWCWCLMEQCTNVNMTPEFSYILLSNRLELPYRCMWVCVLHL